MGKQEGSIASDPITITVGGKSHYHRSKEANLRPGRLVPGGPREKPWPLMNPVSVGPPSKNGQNWVKIGIFFSKSEIFPQKCP